MNKKFFFVTIFITVLLGIPRFAHKTPDSIYYIQTSNYFSGEMEKTELKTPFAYRIVIPYLAHLGPLRNLEFNFAIINLFATVLSYLIFAFFLKDFFGSDRQMKVGMILLLFSFPSFNYSSAVLTDAGSFLVIVVTAYLLLKERYFFVIVSLCLGVFIRESVISMALAASLYMLIIDWKSNRIKSVVYSILTLILPVCVYLFLRIHFLDVEGHIWIPSVSIVIRNLKRPDAWATFLLTLAPLLILLIIGVKRNGLSFLKQMPSKSRIFIYSVAVSSVLLILYSIVAAFMSGRFVWPFYIVLIPVAILSVKDTKAMKRLLEPISRMIF
jgi:hypothetical protein